MRYRSAIVMLVPLMIVSNVVFGQVAGRGDSLSTETLSVHADSSYTCSLDMLMLMMDRRREPATSVSFYSRPDLNLGLLSGYRVYRASTLECTLRGMGAGMTAGMAAGAFGMMTGTWNEREAWYIAGAAAAIGAIFGRAKADDPEWNIKIRWDPEKTRE